MQNISGIGEKINGRELIAILNKGEIPPRVPFVPVIYEHAASLLGVTPSELAQNEDLIVKGQLTAYEYYKQDLVSVGVDIYNIEAEALGCNVMYFDNLSTPSVVGTIVSDIDDLRRLKVPDPATDGRMPLYISATRRINEIIGKEVFVSGTIVGPFTLAAILRGFDHFITDFFLDEEFALEQLRFATEVSFSYAKAFIDLGVGISINESWIAPPLLSPDIFELKVFEFEKQLISRIKSCGLKNVALICGGNTSPIADLLAHTGTSLLMVDANSDQAAYKLICDRHNINLRASIDSALLQKGDDNLLEEAVKNVISKCSANGRFIFGCGVVSADTPFENVLKLKALVNKHNPYN
jgi:uroporphyrinogen decarboxylase